MWKQLLVTYKGNTAPLDVDYLDNSNDEHPDVTATCTKEKNAWGSIGFESFKESEFEQLHYSTSGDILVGSLVQVQILPLAPPPFLGPRSLIRQHSKISQSICGICLDDDSLVGSSDSLTDMRLGCTCAIHYDCLVGYIKSCLRNKDTINKNGIHCPYYSKEEKLSRCKQLDSCYFILPDDVEAISAYANNEELCGSSLSVTEALKLQVFMEKDAKEVEISETDDYINSTTKPCPKCRIRTTHYHGHNCHHISPVSDGCPNCHTHYCYKCLSMEDENIRLRTQRSLCNCGYWSQYCQPLQSDEAIQSFVALLPVPFDTRCGCVICPECRAGSPCPQCPGTCDVCMGYINPGPLSIIESATWKPVPKVRINAAQRQRLYHDLCRACMHESARAVAVILEVGKDFLDVNTRDYLGRCPIDYCCDVGDVEKVRLLVEQASAEVNARDREGYTPLLRSCEYGHVAIAEYLVSVGASVNTTDFNGETSLIKVIDSLSILPPSLSFLSCLTDIVTLLPSLSLPSLPSFLSS